MDDDNLQQKIINWPYTSSFNELLELVKEEWAYPSYFSRMKDRPSHLSWRTILKEKGTWWVVSTGGMSDNEFLIGCLKQNAMFWIMCWQASFVGGHFIFYVSDTQDKQKESG